MRKLENSAKPKKFPSINNFIWFSPHSNRLIPVAVRSAEKVICKEENVRWIASGWVGRLKSLHECVPRNPRAALMIYERKTIFMEDKTFSFEKLELRVSLLYSCLPTEGFSLLKLLNFVSAPFLRRSKQISHLRLYLHSLKAGIYYQREKKCLFHKSNAFCAGWALEKLFEIKMWGKNK